jgi:hypothetical protein
MQSLPALIHPAATNKLENLTGELPVEAHAATDWPQVAGIWAEVAAESPYTTFFLSPEWVGAWIEVFGASLPVEILVFRSPQRAVGICLLVRRTLSNGPIRIRCVFLNTAGENEDESPIVEFNNLLCLADWEQAIATALISYIKMQPWDEIWLNGFCRGLPLDALRRASSGLTVKRAVRTTFFVDLKRIRESGAAYETFLRSTGRARLRQSLRAWGETEVVTPEGFPDALRMLHDLVDLHTTTCGIGASQAPSFLPFFAHFTKVSFVAVSRSKEANCCGFKAARRRLGSCITWSTVARCTFTNRDLLTAPISASALASFALRARSTIASISRR